MTRDRPILCVLTLVFVATAGRAAAQLPTPNVNDGTALLRECGAALRAADGGEPHCAPPTVARSSSPTQ